jgi:hypothetical protein
MKGVRKMSRLTVPTNRIAKIHQKERSNLRAKLCRTLGMLAAATLGFGCTQETAYTTKVMSIPPGARIEVDQDYIGEAPLDVQWEGWGEKGFFSRNHTVTATSTGRRSQTKWFRGEDNPHLQDWADPIPKTILFDFGHSSEAAPLKTYVTNVIAEPPGARIEVNDEYRGDAPLKLKWKSRTGHFASPAVVRALPTEPGHQVHERVFDSFSPIPDTILFDMRIISNRGLYRPKARSGRQDNIPDEAKAEHETSEHAEKIWVKCSNPYCGATYQMDQERFYAQIEARVRANADVFQIPALVCKQCGKASIYRAIRCDECGHIFFYGLHGDFGDTCPECGYSRAQQSVPPSDEEELSNSDEDVD